MSIYNPLVSIIIPVYNTDEKLFEKCMDSLLRQTYTNCEYIVVDDGSRQEVATFLDEYTKKDNRVSVIHQENGGESSARNTGLSHIKGEYFAHFDADDYCSNDLIERLVIAAETNKSDLCIAGFVLLNDTTDKEIARVNNRYDCSLEIDEKTRVAIMQQSFHYVSSDIPLMQEPYTCSTKELWLQGKVWGKLYRTEIHKDHRFVLGIRTSTDAVYTIDVLKTTQKVSFVKDTFYYYYHNKGSITKSKPTMDGIDIKFDAIHKKLSDYPQVFQGMYSLLMFGVLRGFVVSNGCIKGYYVIKKICSMPEIASINESLSMDGVAHKQEQRTRMCLRKRSILLLTIFIKLGILKEKIKLHRRTK